MQNHSIKITVIIAICVSIAAVFYFDMAKTIDSQLAVEDSISIDLKRGSSIKHLANDLNKMGLLDQPKHQVYWSRLHGMSTKLKAGEYRIDPGDNLAVLLSKLLSGKVEQYKLTLIEGWNFKEVVNAINSHPQITHTLEQLPRETIMQKLGYENQHPEGRFYPDTYYIHKGTSDVEIYRRAYEAMDNHLNRLWAKRDGGLPLKSAYEALILASIVEKESAIAEERTTIAGVFINRLRKRMRLQTDPTVIYGMGEEYKGDIRFKDLRQDTPYNTYTRHGLPPTPIAMPGIGAIQAVMHPEETDALYFVAYSDGSGRHFFSTNLDDHVNAVNQYQKKQKNK